MISTKEEQPHPSTTQQIPRRLVLEDKNLRAVRSWTNPQHLQIVKKRNPHIWKFHQGGFLKDKHSETTVKVLTMAMKLPKKLQENFPETGDARLYCLNPGLKRFSSLRNLDLNLKGVGSEGINSLCRGLKGLASLQNISLRFIDSEIFDEEIKRLGDCLSRFPRLKSLNLGFIGCANMRSGKLKCLGERLKHLRRLENFGLELSNSVSVTDHMIYILKDWLKKFVFLRGLSLSFSRLKTITNIGMVHLRDILKDHGEMLEKIDLRFDKCLKITNTGLGNLSQGIKDLTLLEDIHLYFSQCSEIEGLGIDAISQVLKGLRGLKNINLNLYGEKTLVCSEKSYFCREISSPKGCNLNLKVRLGDQELQQVSQSLLESFPFQVLNLCFSNCSNLTDAGLKDLGRRFGILTALENLQLKFMNCEGVTSQGLLGLCEGFESLKSMQDFSLTVVEPLDSTSEYEIYRFYEILKKCPALKSFRLDCDFKQLSVKGSRIKN